MVCVAAVCSFVFSRFLSPESLAFILLSTLSAIAILFDPLPAMLAAAATAIIWDYFFMPPLFSLSIGSPEGKLIMCTYFLLPLVSGMVKYTAARQEKKKVRQTEPTQAPPVPNTLFFSSIAHELKSPLTAIITAVDNLAAGGGTWDEGKSELVSEISAASLRLNYQFENLLNASRLECGAIKPQKNWCDVRDVVNSTLAQLETELQQHIIKTAFQDGLPLFKLDFGLMQVVLQNLLRNAAVYTKAGSLILIEASAGKNALKMVVQDNGKGFAENETSKVFEKFYRPNGSPAGGTGLGLAIVKGFIEAQGGTVHLKNIKTGGASFTLTIPAEHSI